MDTALAVRPDTKVFSLTQLKLDSGGEGTFEAAFANLEAIDHDGDGYDPGAIGQQRVMISQWNHGSWDTGAKALPIGVGTTSERDGWAMITGEFDLSDPDGVKTYEKLKYLYAKGFPVEWSFALPDTDWRMEERDGRQVRIFTRITIPEVSPVLMGAGIDTHLTSIKERKVEEVPKDIEPMQFATQLDNAVEAVEAVLLRAKQIQSLREEKGKDGMSRRSTRRLKALRDALVEATADIDELLVDHNIEFAALAAKYQTQEGR